MKAFSIFLLLLLVAALAAAGYWISSRQNDAPPWQSAWREARVLLPEIPRRGAKIDVRIRMSGSGGSSPLALSMQRGIELQLRGNVQNGGGDLRYELRSGEEAASWRELREGGRSLLALGGLPYRAPQKGFLGVDWFRALDPEPLLRSWSLLRRSRAEGTGEEDVFAYELRRFPRRPYVRSLQVPLLLALGFQKSGSVRSLLLRRTGAPGGIALEKTFPGQSFDRLLGAGDVGLRTFTFSMRYEIKKWGAVRLPPLPPGKSVQPEGKAALEVALLPFFVGLQGGKINS